jgi:DNA segregation ATPase FtsK/SpoIIIE-like protein
MAGYSYPEFSLIPEVKPGGAFGAVVANNIHEKTDYLKESIGYNHRILVEWILIIPTFWCCFFFLGFSLKRKVPQNFKASDDGLDIGDPITENGVFFSPARTTSDIPDGQIAAPPHVKIFKYILARPRKQKKSKIEPAASGVMRLDGGRGLYGDNSLSAGILSGGIEDISLRKNGGALGIGVMVVARNGLNLSANPSASTTHPDRDGQNKSPTLPSIGLLHEADLDLGDKWHMGKKPEPDMASPLMSAFAEFGVRGSVLGSKMGPVVTAYEFLPEPSVKTSRVIALADDIASTIAVPGLRISQMVNKSSLSIEVPNPKKSNTSLIDLMRAPAWTRNSGMIPLIFGRDSLGDEFTPDLTQLPSLLITGCPGVGKSMQLHAALLSILFRFRSDECKLLLIDPVGKELSLYDNIDHAIGPAVLDPALGVEALDWATIEMERRYRSMSQIGVRSMASFNEKLRTSIKTGIPLIRRVQTGFNAFSGAPVFEDVVLALEPMAMMVVVIDDLSSLMVAGTKQVESALIKLAQMGKAAGIHVIASTNRSSPDILTGSIRASFPAKLAFKASSKMESRVVLGDAGAECLLDCGDMLYAEGGRKVVRVHAPSFTRDDVQRVVGFLRRQKGAA